MGKAEMVDKTKKTSITLRESVMDTLAAEAELDNVSLSYKINTVCAMYIRNRAEFRRISLDGKQKKT